MNVRGRWLFLLVAACQLLPLRALFAADAASAYSEGQSYGTAQQSSPSTVSGFDTAKLPNYNANPSQTSLYSGASLFQPGVDKINSCASYTPGSSAVENQECEAVNFLAKNPTRRVNVSISPSDPIRSANNESASNPKDVLKRFGMDLDGNPGQCQEVTRVTDTSYRNEVCYETVEVETLTCSIGRNIVVDADSNYLCNTTYQSISTQTCRRRVSLTSASVVQNCVNGQTYSASGIRDGYVAVDEVTLDYVCNSSETSGPIPIKIYAHGSHGACIGPQSFSADFTSTTGWISAPNLMPDWEASCRLMTTYYRISQACSAVDPNCQIQLLWYWNGRSDVLTLSFLHPSQQRVNYVVANECAPLEQRSQ